MEPKAHEISMFVFKKDDKQCCDDKHQLYNVSVFVLESTTELCGITALLDLLRDKQTLKSHESRDLGALYSVHLAHYMLKIIRKLLG